MGHGGKGREPTITGHTHKQEFKCATRGKGKKVASARLVVSLTSKKVLMSEACIFLLFYVTDTMMTRVRYTVRLPCRVIRPICKQKDLQGKNFKIKG